jgi:hypothetical protein
MTRTTAVTSQQCHDFLGYLLKKHPLPAGCKVTMKFADEVSVLGMRGANGACTANVAKKTALIEISKRASWLAYDKFMTIGHEYQHVLQFLRDGRVVGEKAINVGLEYEANMFGIEEAKAYIGS